MTPIRPICPECKTRQCEKSYNKNSAGETIRNQFRSTCRVCRYPSNEAYNKSFEVFAANYRRPYQAIVDRSICSGCGFKPQDVCQMDVDHIDGNHDNNDRANLQSLCSNCHRLKTFKPTLFEQLMSKSKGQTV